MQNDPDQATKPMGDGPDGLIVSEARDESTIDNLENGPFRLGCGVGTLIENASHVAVTFRGAVALGYACALFVSSALVLYVLTDVMTFAYFYPRNEIMFRAAQLNDVTLLRETWASWSAMNWVRSSILLAGVILSCVSLHKIYSI